MTLFLRLLLSLVVHEITVTPLLLNGGVVALLRDIGQAKDSTTYLLTTDYLLLMNTDYVLRTTYHL